MIMPTFGVMPTFPRNSSSSRVNTLAAATGASTRELMARMGHASPRAALIYQHATSDRDQAIASALSNLAAEAELTRIVPRDGRAMEAL